MATDVVAYLRSARRFDVAVYVDQVQVYRRVGPMGRAVADELRRCVLSLGDNPALIWLLVDSFAQAMRVASSGARSRIVARVKWPRGSRMLSVDGVSGAGVYELRHRASGYVYVGASIDLKRRAFEWKLALDWCAGRLGRQRGRYRFRQPSARFQSAARNVDPKGWTFEVVFSLPADAHPAGEVLWAHECAFMDRAFEEAGREKLLNSYYPGGPYPHGFRPTYIRAV